MNRRYFVKGVIATAALAVGAPSIYEWLRLSRKPDLQYLVSRKKLIGELAETIIPETDSPGAKSAGVEEYIIYCVSNNLPRKEVNCFIDGLHKVEHYCLKKYDTTYEKCSIANKNEVFSMLQNSRLYHNNNFLKKVDRKFRGRSFFTLFRELTIIGYCTSEPGATKGLAYDFVPGSYESCISLKKNQKAWATK